MKTDNSFEVIESHPWPFKSIYEYQNIRHDKWGVLEFYRPANGGLSSFAFRQDITPTDQQIINRWGRIMMNRAPAGESTLINLGIKSKIEIHHCKFGFYLGCRTTDNKISRESVEFWETRDLALTEYLTASWTQVESLQLELI